MRGHDGGVAAVSGTSRVLNTVQRKPPAVSGFSQIVGRRSGSEVALDTEVNRKRAHIAILPSRQWPTWLGHRRARGPSGDTRHIRLQVRIENVAAEGQILDRCPAGRETDLGNRKARVAGISTPRDRYCGMKRSVVGHKRRLSWVGGQCNSVGQCSTVCSAPHVLGGLVVADLSDATVEAARPLGIPVVVKRTAETPAATQLNAGLQRCHPATVDAVVDRTDRNRAGRRRPALRRVERARERSGGTEDIFRRTNTVGTFDLDVVAGTEGNILDLQRSGDGTTP